MWTIRADVHCCHPSRVSAGRCDARRRTSVAPGSPNLADFIGGWLRDVVVPGLAPMTAATYELFARLYIVPDLGKKRLDRLAVRDVQAWMNALRARCQCCAQGKDAARPEPRCCAAGRCCRQVASEWTIHQAWTVLGSVLSAAMREELVTRNVAALVRVPVPRARKPAVWTVDQARQFLESARMDADPLYAGYVLMLVLGLRRGELLGLSWDDVDLEHGEARIAWQVQRVKGELLRRQTKTASSDAPLPVPEICVKGLEQRKVTEACWRLAAGEAWAGSGLVLTTRLGDPLDPRNLHRYFKARAVKADVPVISVHATRRTCASLLVALDVHPRVAMSILRHSKIAVTRTFTARSPPARRGRRSSGSERPSRDTRCRTFLGYRRRRGPPRDAGRDSGLWWSQGDSNP